MKGAGAADVGPDLGQPMNPTQYLTPQGLRALTRNPKAVRTWPQQQMPAFDAQALPDAASTPLLPTSAIWRPRRVDQQGSNFLPRA